MTLASEGGTNKVVKGAVSIVFLKDPTDPKWRSDAAMKLYRTIMARYAKGANVNDVYHVYGMAVAYETVRLLKAAGKKPTRAAVGRADGEAERRVEPVPAARDRGQDERRRSHFPIEQALLQRWSKGRWTSFGGLWGYGAGS